MRLLRKLYIIAFIVPITMLSCGDDNDDTKTYSIDGKWETKEMQINTTMSEASGFDRNINGLYVRMLETDSIVRDYQAIASGYEVGNLIISTFTKGTGTAKGTQNNTYSVKGDSLYITEGGSGKIFPVYFIVGSDYLLTRHKVERTENRDDLSSIMTDLGIGSRIDDTYPSYGTTGTLTMTFSRIKE